MPIFIRPATEFTLPNHADRLSPARLSRRPDTTGLQEKFLGILPRMPQIALRGHCDKSIPGLDSYLISSSPIRGLLSEDDLVPPNFLARLYLSVSSAFNRAALHARYIAAAENAVLSFYSIDRIGGPMTEGDDSKLSHGFFRSSLADPGLPIGLGETFPHYCLTPSLDPLLAQLMYDNRSYRASLEDATERKLEILFFMRRDAIVYRDTLNVFMRLFKSEGK